MCSISFNHFMLTMANKHFHFLFTFSCTDIFAAIRHFHVILLLIFDNLTHKQTAYSSVPMFEEVKVTSMF